MATGLDLVNRVLVEVHEDPVDVIAKNTPAANRVWVLLKSAYNKVCREIQHNDLFRNVVPNSFLAPDVYTIVPTTEVCHTIYFVQHDGIEVPEVPLELFDRQFYHNVWTKTATNTIRVKNGSLTKTKIMYTYYPVCPASPTVNILVPEDLQELIILYTLYRHETSTAAMKQSKQLDYMQNAAIIKAKFDAIPTGHRVLW